MPFRVRTNVFFLRFFFFGIWKFIKYDLFLLFDKLNLALKRMMAYVQQISRNSRKFYCYRTILSLSQNNNRRWTFSPSEIDQTKNWSIQTINLIEINLNLFFGACHQTFNCRTKQNRAHSHGLDRIKRQERINKNNVKIIAKFVSIAKW